MEWLIPYLCVPAFLGWWACRRSGRASLHRLAHPSRTLTLGLGGAALLLIAANAVDAEPQQASWINDGVRKAGGLLDVPWRVWALAFAAIASLDLVAERLAAVGPLLFARVLVRLRLRPKLVVASTIMSTAHIALITAAIFPLALIGAGPSVQTLLEREYSLALQERFDAQGQVLASQVLQPLIGNLSAGRERDNLRVRIEAIASVSDVPAVREAAARGYAKEQLDTTQDDLSAQVDAVTRDRLPAEDSLFHGPPSGSEAVERGLAPIDEQTRLRRTLNQDALRAVGAAALQLVLSFGFGPDSPRFAVMLESAKDYLSACLEEWSRRAMALIARAFEGRSPASPPREALMAIASKILNTRDPLTRCFCRFHETAESQHAAELAGSSRQLTDASRIIDDRIRAEADQARSAEP